MNASRATLGATLTGIAVATLVGSSMVLRGGVSTGVRTDDIVVIVDGDPITREAFDDYSAVLTRPDGVLDVDRGEILGSLINQSIVANEADKRGLVVSEADVERRVSAAMGLELGIAGKSRTGGEPAFRRRMRSFLQFELVKAAVLGRFDDSPDGRQRANREWGSWLASARSCAEIVVVDTALGVASTTPAPTC